MTTYTNGQSFITPDPEDNKAVEQLITDFSDAWNMNNARELSTIFTEDADFMNFRGQSFIGADEIQKHHAPAFSARFKNSKFTVSKSKLLFIKPDVASVDFWWDMTGVSDPQGNSLPQEKGVMTFIASKNQNGKWRIIVMHNLLLHD